MIHAVAGDTRKAVTLSLDLTPVGTTVTYHFKPRPGTSPIAGSATIEDAAASLVTFPVPAAGRYDAEFQASAGGESETAPSSQADVLIVREAAT